MTKIQPTATVLLAGALAASAVPASAQRVYQNRKPQTTEAKPSVAPNGDLNVSKELFAALAALRAAVDAGNHASVPALAAAAQALAKTPNERLLIGQLQLKSAVAAKDPTAMSAAVEAMRASGLVPQGELVALYGSLGGLYAERKQYEQAAAAYERVLALQPGRVETTIQLAEARNSQGRTAEGIALLRRAIQAKTAAGQKAPESWHRRVTALAYNARLPDAVALSRDWVAAYPTAANWKDALAVYRGMLKPDQDAQFDMLRLARATGALATENEYEVYAIAADRSGAAAEADAVLKEASARQLGANNANLRELRAAVSSKLGSNAPSLLDESARLALADPSARPAQRTADALYGIANYAKAAELYRAALGKRGADASLLNLRLGMALARAGDRTGATAALNAVTGPRAELAKYWLVYVATRA